MDFVIQWLWYLLAFVVGSLVAWLIAVAHGEADDPKRKPSRIFPAHASWERGDAKRQLVADGPGVPARPGVDARLVDPQGQAGGARVRDASPAGADAGDADALPKIDADADADADATPRVPQGWSRRDADVGEAGAVAAGVAGGAAAAKFADSSDGRKCGHGTLRAGSARVAAGAVRRRATTSRATRIRCSTTRTDSPSYKQTIAEVWFRDEPTAEAAGFNRWDSGKSQREKG